MRGILLSPITIRVVIWSGGMEGPVPSGLALPSQTQGQMGLEGKNQHAETGMHQMTQESHGLREQPRENKKPLSTDRSVRVEH